MEQVQTWNEIVRRWRAELGLTRADLAARAGLAVDTVKSLELGRRQPSREVLSSILDALRVDRRVRNLVFEGAGFRADGLDLSPHNPEFFETLAEMADTVAHLPWPSFVANEMFEVLAPNEAYLRLLGIQDYPKERPEPLDRNLMVGLSEARFADRIGNWEECARLVIALMKGHPRGAEQAPESLSTYYAAVFERFAAGDPLRVGRFLRMWDETPPKAPRPRFTYRIVWDHAAAGQIEFLGISHETNSRDGLNYHDWVPVGADAWSRFAEVTSPSFDRAGGRDDRDKHRVRR